MATANGRTGSVTGQVGTSGIAVAGKVDRFRYAATRVLNSVAGFGDGGDDYHEDGIVTHVFSVAGWLNVGTAIGTSFTGTTSTLGTVALVAGTGQTYTGTAKMSNFQIDCNYPEGRIPFSAQGVFQGSPVEA